MICKYFSHSFHSVSIVYSRFPSRGETWKIITVKGNNIFTQQRSRSRPRPCLCHDPVGVDVDSETFRKKITLATVSCESQN